MTRTGSSALLAIVAALPIAGCSGTNANPTSPKSSTSPASLPGASTIVLSGNASEMPPTPKVLPGVTIQIANGPDNGLSVVTDANGRFRFTSPPGTITIEATKDGYSPWRLSNVVLDRDQQIELALYPDPPTDKTGAGATARCNDGSWSWAVTRAAACPGSGGVAYGVCPGPICDASATHRAAR
jgi:hypothetical protein